MSGKATVHLSGEGENYEMGASRLSLKATEKETGGAFFLSETTVEPGFPGPPLHVHRELTDMFYVLNFNVPGGFERYMRDLVAAWQAAGGPPEPAQLGAIASNYDIEVVAPPSAG